MNKYERWILENYPTPKDCLLACREATEDMISFFPELKRVRGLAHVKEPRGLPPTKAPHWWCVSPEGEIIDPTSLQYPLGIERYDPVDETRGEPTGKCMECGNISYNKETFCSKTCEKNFLNYLNEDTI